MCINLGEPASSSHAGGGDEQDMNCTDAQVGAKRAAAEGEGASGISVTCRADHRQGVGVGAAGGASATGAALRGGGATEERRDDVEGGSDRAGVGGVIAITERRAYIGGERGGGERGAGDEEGGLTSHNAKPVFGGGGGSGGGDAISECGINIGRGAGGMLRKDSIKIA